jgi:glucose-1-phosphate cytidylyltransferase
MIEGLQKSENVASFMAVKPSQSFHVVSFGEGSSVESIRPVPETDIMINGGYFVFRKEIFQYIKEDEDLVEEPFGRMIEEHKLIGYRHDGFWCMDTFKDHQVLTDMYRQGDAPWELWKVSA